MKFNSKYSVVASLVPPSGTGQFSLKIEVDENNYKSVKTQINQRKDKIVFEMMETKQPVCINNAYPVIYITTEVMKISSNLVLPDSMDKKIILD